MNNTVKKSTFEKEDKDNIKEWVKSFFIAILLVVIIRTFFLGYAVVDGPSMENTIHNGDRVFYVKIEKPKIGDIVVVHLNNGLKIIKRVVGEQGDTIEIKKGVLYVNGKVKKENYIKEPMLPKDFKKVVVPNGQIFVMGDNRNISADSRVFGTFNLSSQYEGKVVLEIWHSFRLF